MAHHGEVDLIIYEENEAAEKVVRAGYNGVSRALLQLTSHLQQINRT